MDITSSSSSPILIKSGKATVVLADGSENVLTDGSYTETQEENATLYAEEDLTIQ